MKTMPYFFFFFFQKGQQHQRVLGPSGGGQGGGPGPGGRAKKPKPSRWGGEPSLLAEPRFILLVPFLQLFTGIIWGSCSWSPWDSRYPPLDGRSIFIFSFTARPHHAACVSATPPAFRPSLAPPPLAGERIAGVGERLLLLPPLSPAPLVYIGKWEGEVFPGI